MSDLEQRVAERLRELAGRAGTHDPAAALATIDADERDRRRRVTRWAAGLVALAVLAGAAALLRPGDPDPRTASASGSASASATWARALDRPELYDLPRRGRVAGDREFRTRLAARSWGDGSDGSAADRAGLLADPADRRVVYAADVPGGHRWAVVVGRAAGGWVYAWFAGPAGASADQLQLAAAPDHLSGTLPLALLDQTTSPAPLVVLGRPGDEARWSAGTERAPDGTLIRTFTDVPVVDGVPTATVTAPIAWDSGQVVLLRDDSITPVPLVTTGSPASPAVVLGPYPTDPGVLARCMEPLGVQVTVDPDGTMTYTESADLELSSGEQAARQQAEAHCQGLATGGG